MLSGWVSNVSAGASAQGTRRLFCVPVIPNVHVYMPGKQINRVAHGCSPDVFCFWLFVVAPSSAIFLFRFRFDPQHQPLLDFCAPRFRHASSPSRRWVDCLTGSVSMFRLEAIEGRGSGLKLGVC